MRFSLFWVNSESYDRNSHLTLIFIDEINSA